MHVYLSWRKGTLDHISSEWRDCIWDILGTDTDILPEVGDFMYFDADDFDTAVEFPTELHGGCTGKVSRRMFGRNGDADTAAMVCWVDVEFIAFGDNPDANLTDVQD